ncbi:hypothetical protein GF378_01705 [Candidatus Pacearchaeota archaeon]|nr:hypothetical protein [Candidatus Pacearchaeota archaeon]
MKNIRERFNNYVKEKGNALGEKYLSGTKIGDYLTSEVNVKAPMALGLAGFLGISSINCSLPRHKNPKNRDERIWNDKLDFYDTIHNANERAEAKDKASRNAYLNKLGEYDEKTGEIKDKTKMIKGIIKEVEENQRELRESMEKAREKARAGDPDYNLDANDDYNGNQSEWDSEDEDDSDENPPVIIK